MNVKDVLDRSDMHEFISRYAKEKLKKLQRGSVKGFISDNKQIKSLGVFDARARRRSRRSCRFGISTLIRTGLSTTASGNTFRPPTSTTNTG